MTHPDLDEILALAGISRRAFARRCGYHEAADWVTKRAPVPEPVAAWARALGRWLDQHPYPSRAA